MLNKKNGTDGGESFKNNFMNIAVILPILYHIVFHCLYTKTMKQHCREGKS